MKKAMRRQKNQIAELIANIDDTTNRGKNAVYAAPLEKLLEVENVLYDFKILISEGWKHKDPEILLAAMQKLHDGMGEILSKYDPDLRKILDNRENSIAAHSINQMTQGEYKVLTNSGSMFSDIEVRRALVESLRETYESVLSEERQKDNIPSSEENIQSPKV